MKASTVADLLRRCQELVDRGLGDKIVLLSDDDEGNGFHTLFYDFTTKPESIKAYADMDMFHDGQNPEDVVILG